MICPVEIAHEMSALRAARMREHGEHGLLPEGRDGAGDESTGRDVAGDGHEDHLAMKVCSTSVASSPPPSGCLSCRISVRWTTLYRETGGRAPRAAPTMGGDFRRLWKSVSSASSSARLRRTNHRALVAGAKSRLYKNPNSMAVIDW